MSLPAGPILTISMCVGWWYLYLDNIGISVGLIPRGRFPGECIRYRLIRYFRFTFGLLK